MLNHFNKHWNEWVIILEKKKLGGSRRAAASIWEKKKNWVESFICPLFNNSLLNAINARECTWVEAMILTDNFFLLLWFSFLETCKTMVVVLQYMYIWIYACITGDYMYPSCGNCVLNHIIYILLTSLSQGRRNPKSG